MKSMRCSIVVVAVLAALLAAGCQSLNPEAGRRERAQTYVHHADQYLQKGELNKALAAFGEALRQNPNLTEAHMGVGTIYRQRGQYKLASKAYEKASATDPTNFNAHYYLGLMRQLGGKVADAIQAYLQALAINPDSFEGNRDLAAAYLQSGDSGQALPYALRATQLDPDSQAAWTNLAATYSLLGRYDDAVGAYREAAELGPLADQVLLGLADAHLRLGHYQRAINVLNTMLRANKSSLAYERLGYAHFKQRDFKTALKNYRSALKISPQEPGALNGVGAALMTMYIQGGRENTNLRDQAIADWRQSVRHDPDQPRIIDLLSRYSRL